MAAKLQVFIIKLVPISETHSYHKTNRKIVVVPMCVTHKELSNGKVQQTIYGNTHK